MACSKWEESGLLYTSDELSAEQYKEYEEHLKACTECSTELSQYTLCKKKYFTQETLGETTPEFIDTTILRIAARGKSVKPTTLGLFSFTSTRKTIGALVLTLGIVAGFGLMYYNIPGLKSSVALPATFKSTPTSTQPSERQIPQTTIASRNNQDSLSKADTVPFSKRVGNIGQAGVIPVDLTKP